MKEERLQNRENRAASLLAEVASQSMDELSARKIELEQAIAEISAQIAAAKARRIETGEYADAGWMARAQSARRFTGLEHQAVLHEIGKRLRAERAARHEATMAHDGPKDLWYRRFVQAAKRRLTAETFEAIVSEADDAGAEVAV